MITAEGTYICIATYRRNELLANLLDSIDREVSDPPSIIVVDNDPLGGASEVVEGRPGRVRYIHETRPGIAAARNAALEALPPSACAVVFVDDDETVTPGWLDHLIGHANDTGADIVTGPVVSEIPDSAPRWIVRGGFIQRPSHATGEYPFLPATNNTLVVARLFTGPSGYRFSEEFSLTGGSDTELFARIKEERSARIHWCAEAVVHEIVPEGRLRLSWVWQRGVRSGNVLARIQLMRRPRIRVLIGGIARLVYGVGRMLTSALLFRPISYDDSIYVMRGVGFLGALRGSLVQEYARVAAQEGP